MKTQILALIAFVFMNCAFVNAQISILFVNDNAINPANTDLVLDALDQTGLSYNEFDAVAEMRSPDYNEMAPFDLVLWYTGTDGLARYFWDGDDVDNVNLMLYLSEGGWLWVIGLDFLYDRYTAPEAFVEGDFMYDFLGLENYFGQSYNDDGGMGLPQLDLVPGQTISSLDPILWTFATLWYADACLPVEAAQPVYQMGPESYQLSDYYSAIYYDAPSHKALSFYFDPALMDTDENRVLLFADVLDYFSNLVGMDELAGANGSNGFQIFPNPVSAKSTACFGLVKDVNSNECLEIYTTNGSLVKRQVVQADASGKFEIPVEGLSPGIYYVKRGREVTKLLISEK